MSRRVRGCAPTQGTLGLFVGSYGQSDHGTLTTAAQPMAKAILFQLSSSRHSLSDYLWSTHSVPGGTARVETSEESEPGLTLSTWSRHPLTPVLT